MKSKRSLFLISSTFIIGYIVLMILFLKNPRKTPQYQEVPLQNMKTDTKDTEFKETENNIKMNNEYAMRWNVNDEERAIEDYKILSNNEYILNGTTMKKGGNLGKLVVPQDWTYSLINSEYAKPNKAQLKNFQGMPINDFGLEDDRYYYHWYGISGYYDKDFHTKNDLQWIGIDKSKLPSVKPVGLLGTQDVSNIILYSDGHLIIPPYKFPVDKKSFVVYPQKFRDDSKPENGIEREDYLKGERAFCRNGREQYANCLGSDNNYFYFWTQYYDKDETYYFLIRKEKQSDFKLLKPHELLGIVSYDDSINLKKEGVPPPMHGALNYSLNSPALYYDNHKIYIVLPGYGTWSFPIDRDSMQRQEKTIQLVGNEYPTDYAVLSDKDRYYQLIYHSEGDYYELQRIRR